MTLRLLTEAWANVQPTAQSTVLLLIRVSMGWGLFLNDQAPFPFLMAALVTLTFGAGKFSIDRLLQPWFEKIIGSRRPSS